jgi:hypothetical protein
MAEGSDQAKSPAPAAPDESSRDPFMLILIVLLVVVYAVGQWLIFTTLDAKFSALEQRVVDNTDRLDTKITDVEQTVIEATKVLKAAALAAPARAPEPKKEDTTVEPAAPEKPAAPAAAAPATPPAPAAAPAKPAAPAPAQ